MNEIAITWEQVKDRLKAFDQEENRIYGVPNGGLMACALLEKARVVTDPRNASLILDDIFDSGNTYRYYKSMFPDKTFGFLFYKTNTPSTNEYIEQGLYRKDVWLVMPWEKEHPLAHENAPLTVNQNIIRILQYIGEDTEREGLKDTPERVVKSYDQLFKGYNESIENVFTTFDSQEYDQMVILKGFEFYSMCEHHMLPFFGKAYVAYIPDKKIIGISKLARIVDIFSRRLQNQERICEQVTNALMKYLHPIGAACILEGQHLCMQMRGVEKQNAIMSTSSLKGAFLTDATAKSELLQLIKS